MSKPIVVIVCMARSSESCEPQQRPHPWHRCAGGGAVHSIKLRHSGCSSRKKTARRRLLNSILLTLSLSMFVDVGMQRPLVGRRFWQRDFSERDLEAAIAVEIVAALARKGLRYICRQRDG